MQIFISYRRTDSGGWVQAFYQRLREMAEFRDGGVFMDVASIQGGADFVRQIEAAIAVSTVVLVVIGDRWLSVANEKGKRRLDEKDDPVRMEIRLCQKLGVPYLPVLVDGAKMPAKDKLPPAIRSLVNMNAARVSHERFDADFERLLVTIQAKAAERPAAVVDKAEEAQPEDFFAVGWHYAGHSDYPGARACFQAAVTKQPNFARAYAGLAWCSQLEANSMIRRRNYGLAEELLEDAERHIKTGLQQDDTDIFLFVQSGYVRKDIAQTFWNIGHEIHAVQKRQGEWAGRARKAFEASRTHFKMALGIDSQDLSAQNGIASLDLILGDYEQAIERLEWIVKAHPGYSAAQFDLATAFHRRFDQLRRQKKPSVREMKNCLTRFAECCEKLDDLQQQLSPDARKELVRIIHEMTEGAEFVGTLTKSAARK